MTKQYTSLLDWAVEELNWWNSNYTHLRMSYNGLLDWTRNEAWTHCGVWCTKTSLDRTSMGLPFLEVQNVNPQSITKQQWLEAKELKRKQLEEMNMTYAEKCGLRVGSKIVYVGNGKYSRTHSGLNIGDILTLVFDDGTSMPEFKNEDNYRYFDLEKREWKHYTEEKENMNKTFTKSDLKTGMIIKQRCGEIAMVLLNTSNGDIYSGQCWGPMTNFNDDLTSIYGKRGDIIAVYQPRSNCSFLSDGLLVEDHTVLWEEPKAPIEHDILMQKIAEHEKSLSELKEQAKKMSDKQEK